MLQSWKNLPGPKVANSKKGLKWTKDPSNEFRIMEAFPDSDWPSQHVDYVRLKKNGSFLDITGNPVPSTLSGNIPNPDFEGLTHLPLTDMTDDLLDLFFN